MTPYEMVREFHETFGLPIRSEPTTVIPERDLRVALLLEELGELHAAIADDDVIEEVDAIVDIAYVAWGTWICHGLDEDDFSNLNYRTETYLTYEVLNYGTYSKRGDDRYIDGLIAIIAGCYHLAKRMGFDLDRALSEVHRSNMSKLGEDGLPIYREDGKVMKGKNFSPPDIAKFLKENQ